MDSHIEESLVIQIVTLYQQGQTLLAISSQFNISYFKVRTVLRKHEVPMRKQGGVRKKTSRIILPEQDQKNVGKYDHINFEPVSEGMTYREYLQRYGIEEKKQWY